MNGNTTHIQAIANTAAFHFGFIEQAGSSLYATLSQKVSSSEVLKITLGIGGDEICHFLEWVDFSGNGVQPPIAPLTDPTNGLAFPDFNATGNPLLQTNLIFPVPCEFISPNLPHCSVIRPTTPRGGLDALGAINGFIADGLFIGQPKANNFRHITDYHDDVQGVFCRAAFLPIPFPILETLSGAIYGAVMPKGRQPQYAKPKMPKGDERAS